MVTIVEAQAHDMEAICRLSNQINEQHHQNLPEIFRKPTSLLQDANYWQTFMGKQHSIVLVANIGNAIVGAIAATVQLSDSTPFLVPCLRCRILTIVVDEVHQRQGIGKALMSAVENWARAKGAKTIGLEVMAFNRQAFDFYELLGFEILTHKMQKDI
ncbi:ribosomal protein S18 acetylase RimI-like enzyme [Alteromonadaceae bacterium 2753L.S.0a.02]|nr:ribosomal protein S18 acetylase RimI-like enzyme [Alteromonadaceae bacterium 2753L.S.0a.02]